MASWSLVSWSRGLLVSWSLDILVSVYLGLLVTWPLGSLVSWSCGVLVSGPIGLLISLSLCLWSLSLLVSWSLGLLVSWSLVSLPLSPSLLSLSFPQSCYIRSAGEKLLSSKFGFSRGVYIHLLAMAVLGILGANASGMESEGGGRTANH